MEDSENNKKKSIIICTMARKDSKEQLKIIAVRPLKGCPDYILRALHVEQIYYFNRNFHIDSKGICTYTGKKDRSLPCDFFSTHKESEYSHTPHIHLNAIVGKNGDGKSSLVELLMRIINNLSNRIFESDSQYEGYYINGLCAELYYTIEKTILFNGENTTSWKFYRISIKDNDLQISLQNDQLTVKNNVDVPDPFEKIDVDKAFLENFFYTMVSNYSIFAYNVYDFCNEWDKGDDYETCWLHHLFHKNDGYQLPIVLHPFRDRGNIQINVEHNLIKNRLITLFIEPPKNDSVNFRIINEKQKAYSLQCTLPMTDYAAEEEEEDVTRIVMRGSEDIMNWNNVKYINIKKEWQKCINDLNGKQQDGIEIIMFDRAEQAILEQWRTIYDFPLNTDYSDDLERKKLYYAAKEYLVYKTISVTRKYKSYLEFFSLVPEYATTVNTMAFEDKVTKLINRMSIDPSHVTLKIRQTIAFLKFQIDTWDYSQPEILLDTLYSKIHPFEGKDKRGHVWEVIDLLPPPIFEIEINLINNLNQKERFSSLSSGERQLIYSVSSILYHLRNLNSVEDNFLPGNPELEQGYIHYNHVNLVLEEVELYFHPEFQCQYVKYLLDSIYSINLPKIESINITFVTHSPFVLSDIPLDNVLFLENGLPVTKMQENTFGANIYNLYKNGFFLDGAPIGAFAKEKIQELFSLLQLGEATPLMMEEIRLIGEPLIRNQLIKCFNQNLPQANEDRIRRLEEELKQLKDKQQ